MLCLVRSLLRKMWGVVSVLSLVPLGAKSVNYDAGPVHATHWSWEETALPPAAVLITEVAWHCCCRRRRQRRLSMETKASLREILAEPTEARRSTRTAL